MGDWKPPKVKDLAPKGSSKPKDPKAQERATSKERRSVGYAEKSLVRLLGRLSSTPELNDSQKERLGTLLTGIKPKKVGRIARQVELPESLALELTDTARRAQGLSPLPELTKREDKLTSLVAKAAPRIERRVAETGEASGFKEYEQAKDLAQRLPAAQVKEATKALKGTGKEWRKFLLDAAGQDLENKGLGEAFAGALAAEDSILGAGMKLVAAPGQAVLGGVAEGPGGAWRGLTGKEQYTPIQTALRVAGKSETEAAKAEGDLPGLVRFPTNLVGYAATDPLTYLSFGTSAASKTAVRSLAPKIAEAGGRSVDDVIEGLTTRGVKSLSDVERAALPETSSLLRTLTGRGPSAARAERALAGAPGGVKVRGRSIPGTSIKTPGLPGAAILDTPERLFRPRAGVRQAARSGEGWAQGLEPKLEEMLARLEGTKGFADRRLLTRIGKAVRDNKIGDPDDLVALRRSLDVGGGGTPLNAAQSRARDELRSILDDLLDAEHAVGIETARLGTQQAAKEADDLAKKILKVDKEMETAVGARYTSLDERLQALLAKRDEALAKAQGEEYLPHLVQNRPGLFRRTNGETSPLTEPQGGYTIGRKNTDSIEDLNAAAGFEKYDPDPLKQIVRRGLDSNRDVANAGFIREMSTLTDDLGEPLLRVPESLDEIKVLKDAGMVPVPIPKMGDVYVHQALEQDVKRVTAILANDTATKAVMKAFDGYLRWWKGMATVPAPFSGGFSFRNMMSNWFNASWLPDSGVRATVREYAKAGAWQKAMATGWKKSGDPFALIYDDAERALLREAFASGVLNEGFYTVDLGDIIAHAAKPRLRDVGAKAALKRVAKRSNPLSPDFGPIEVGRRFNSAIENNARLALFARNFDTLGADGAAGLVRKYLFDYADLTPFERSAMRRVIPFYTWTRKNLPLQLEAVIKTPGRFSRIEQIRWGINAESEDQDTGPIPRWMLEQQGVVLPEDISNAIASLPESGFDKDTPTMFMPDLPHLGLQETLGPVANLASRVPGLGFLPEGEGTSRALAQFAGNVGGPLGVAKALAEIALQREFFTGRQYYPGGKVEAPSYLAPFVGDAEVYAGKKPVPAVSPGWINLLESAAPVLSKIRTVAPTSETDRDSGARRRFNMATGLNLWPLGEATVRSEILRRIATADAIRVEAENRGAEVPDTDDIKDKTSKAKAPKVDWKKLARNG